MGWLSTLISPLFPSRKHQAQKKDSEHSKSQEIISTISFDSSQDEDVEEEVDLRTCYRFVPSDADLFQIRLDLYDGFGSTRCPAKHFFTHFPISEMNRFAEFIADNEIALAFCSNKIVIFQDNFAYSFSKAQLTKMESYYDFASSIKDSIRDGEKS